MRGLRAINLALAFLAVLAPMAHLLELPNKLALEGPLWLGVQQNLYRGWGPYVGAPIETAVLVTTIALAIVRLGNFRSRWLTMVAAITYAGMIGCFFVFNDPVNRAVNGWTTATLPKDWPNYRWQWEIGHAMAAILSLIGLVLLLHAWFVETRGHNRGR